MENKNENWSAELNANIIDNHYNGINHLHVHENAQSYKHDDQILMNNQHDNDTHTRHAQ